MRLAAKLLAGEPRLVQRAGRRGVDILTEYWKSLPQGERLESQNYLYLRLVGHVFYQCKIAPQQLLFKHIARRFQFAECLQIYFHHLYVMLLTVQTYTFFAIIKYIRCKFFRPYTN